MSYEPPSDFNQSKECVLHGDLQNMDTFLIRVPKKFDVNCLNDLEYVPGQISNIAADETLQGQITATYQLGSFSGNGLDVSPLVLQQDRSVVGQPVNGFLFVTKSYSTDYKPFNSALPNFGKIGRSAVPMPEGLRERFTPFGSGRPTPCSVQRLKKRKRHREHTSPADEPQHKERKKRKKDRDSNVFNSTTTSVTINQSSSTNPTETDHLDGSSLSLTDPCFQQNGVGLEAHGNLSTSKKHKKKHKKDKKMKTENEETISTHSNGLASPSPLLDSGYVKTPEEILDSKKKKKKKHVSFSEGSSFFLDTSGDISNLSLDLEADNTRDVTLDKDGVERKKKRRKSSESNTASETSLDFTVSTPEAGEHSKKKKKKKKHKHKLEKSF